MTFTPVPSWLPSASPPLLPLSTLPWPSRLRVGDRRGAVLLQLIKSAPSSSCGDSEDDDSEDGDEVMLDVEIGVEIPGAPGPRGDSNVDHDPKNGNDGNHSGNHDDKVLRKELGDPTMMVREGWDGALVFATDIGTQGRGGVLDVAFERSSSWSLDRARAVRLVPTPVHDHVCWCYYCSRREEDDERVIWLEFASGSYCRATGGDGNNARRRWTYVCDGDVDDGLGVCTERHRRRSGGEMRRMDRGETSGDELPFVPLPGTADADAATVDCVARRARYPHRPT